MPSWSRPAVALTLCALAAPAVAERTSFTWTGPQMVDGSSLCPSPQGLDIQIPVSGLPAQRYAVEVSLNLSAAKAGHVDASLGAPNGRGVPLFGRLGSTFTVDGGNCEGSDAALEGTYTFVDFPTRPSFWSVAAAATTIVPPGRYRPAVSGPTDTEPAEWMLSPRFADLADPNGTWTVYLHDSVAGDPTTVHSVTLTFEPLVETVVAGTGGGAIPDGGPTCPGFGASVYVDFDVHDVAGDLTIVLPSVNLSHTWVGDLRVELDPPVGANHWLFSQPGSTGSGASCLGYSADVDGPYSFSDGASVSLTYTAGISAGTVAAGTYRTTDATTGSATTLMTKSIVDAGNRNPNGAWRIRTRDANVFETGTVHSATLTLDTNLAVFHDGFESGDTSAWTAASP